MGKYLIQMKSMDGDAEFDKTYADGVVCEGFAILARDSENGNTVAIHGMNVDIMASIIKGSPQLLAAAILAKARKEAIDVCEADKHEQMLRKMLGMM